MKTPVLRVLAAAAAAFVAPAHAWDIDWSLGLGYEHSDNLGRRGIDPQSGSRVSPFADISASEDGEALRANLIGSVSYSRYSGVDFDPNFNIRLAAEAVWSISPERLLWTVSNSASQQPIDIFASAAPDNVQNSNVFSTGPTLLYRFSEAMGGRTELRYVNSYAESADAFNSDRVVLTSRLLRNLSPVTTLSGNASLESVRLDNPTATASDFQRLGLFGGYDWRSSRTTVRAELGWNWVDLDDGLDNRNGLLARAAGTVALTDISSLDLGLRHELSDSATDLAGNAPNVDELLLPDSVGGVAGAATLNSEVYELDRIDISYSRLGQLFTVRAGGYYSGQDYDNASTSDQRNRGFSLTIDYALSQRTSLGAFAIANWLRFADTDFDSREDEYGLRTRTRLRRDLDLNFEVTHAERDSSDPTGIFDENRVYAAIVWRSR
jgi:hypothetical protein